MSEKYGDFELIKKLATGGMAQIYLARQTGIKGFERLCVVKRILPHLVENDDFIKMFLDEAKIAARLNHPNIVQIYGLDAHEDSYYLAMEYIHGEDLRRVWKRADQRGESIPIPIVLRIIADAANGLDYAHKRVDNGRPLNIVHRDISPQNILVSFEGGVKVVDFGIAKAADKMTHTRSGVLKGKYSYMSPEQAAATSERPVDHRTDLFALGIVLYELLTSSRLFKRANDIQTLTAVSECVVVPPSQVNPRVPRELDALVLKALQKRPEDRYADARGLQRAIEDWLIAHQQPASTAHVAEYMQRLYADRLAEERSEGGVNPERVPELKPAEEEPSPRAQKRPSGSRSRASVSAQRPPPEERQRDGEATSSLRGPRAQRPTPRPTAPSVRAPTVSVRAPPPLEPDDAHTLPPETSPRLATAGRSTAVWAGLAVAALIGAAAVGVMIFRGGSQAPQSFASVKVETDPPGATLVFDGRTLPSTTPTLLPPVPAGIYELIVRKDGYREQPLSVQVPPSGELQLPTTRLVALERAPDPVAKVRVSFDTVPSGARIVVDGVERGPSPAVAELPAGSSVSVRAELAGHQLLDRTVTVGNGPMQAERFELAAVQVAAQRAQVRLWSPVEGATASVDGRPRGALPLTVEAKVGEVLSVRVEAPGHQPATRKLRVTQAEQAEKVELERERVVVRDPPRGMGTVRFVITPITAWAEVSCGPGFRFGATPFPDKQMPAGSHDCTFVNPELGTRKERVEVRPNELSKVTVKFN